MSERLPSHYEALADELRAAAERLETSASRGRGRSTRRALRRAPLLGLAIVAAAGTATGAVLTLQGEPSPPTVGELPTTPQLPKTIRTRSARRRWSRSDRWGGAPRSGCSAGGQEAGSVARVAARRPDPEVSSAARRTFLGNGRGVLAYTIVDRTVASALTSGTSPRRVLPIGDEHLPNGWRAFVQLPRPARHATIRRRRATAGARTGRPSAPPARRWHAVAPRPRDRQHRDATNASHAWSCSAGLALQGDPPPARAPEARAGSQRSVPSADSRRPRCSRAR